MKQKIKYNRNSVNQYRASMTHFYNNYFYNIFMSSYEWTGLDYQEERFLMNSFWDKGTVAICNEKVSGALLVVQYSESKYNIYSFPITATPIAFNDYTNIVPNEPLLIDKDIVIGWCQKNKKGIKELADIYIDKIVEIEMIIHSQLTHHKNPWLIKCTPEDSKKLEELLDNVFNDEEVLYVDSEDPGKIDILSNSSPYVIDKLYQYKKDLENEFLTYLGVDNIAIEKKERLIVDEAESNNALIKDNSDNFLDCMQEFCERVGTVLGHSISVEAKNAPKEVECDEMEDTEDDNVED